MPSSPDPTGPRRTRFALGALSGTWNRRLHFYLGLYFLFFVWLFALTGLLLNHGSWRFAEFWPNRKVTTLESPIRTPTGDTTLERVHDLMRQLGIVGEIQSLTNRSNPARLDFVVSRPGQSFDLKADLTAARATIQRTEVNGWGFFRTLHTFTGVRLGAPESQRDWFMTKIWALSMDAVGVGLIVMVLSGIVLWLGRPSRQRFWGGLALALGLVACGWLVIGLRLISS